MKMHRTVGAVLAGAALLLSAACSQNLTIPDNNNPDVARVLATPADVQSLAISSLRSWYIGATTVDPWVMLNVTGDLMSMNYGNFGARFNNVEPRIPYNNDQASGDAEVAEDPWNNQYSTIGAADGALGAIANGAVLPGGTDKYKALAMFSQAGALMEIALVYDQGFAVDETADPTTIKLVPYTDMETFAKSKIDAVIAFTASQSETYTQDEFPVSTVTPGPTGASYSGAGPIGGGFSSQVINRLANTWGAQLLAYSPRTAAQAASVDWNAVLAYTQKGIGSGGGTPFDFAVVGDYNNWWSDLVSYFARPSWMMVDLKLIHQMAPNVPDSYTGFGIGGATDTTAAGYAALWAPQAPMDARLTSDPISNVVAYQDPHIDSTDFVYAGVVQGTASRGIYMQSPYYYTRYHFYSYDAANPQVGPVPYVLAAENDLLEAEALVRTGGDLTLAAQLVNNTRVNRGHLTPLTATSSTSTFLQAITYELEVECNGTDGYGFFALRSMDQLQAGTLRHLPVPASELQVDGLPVYTFGGVGQPDMNMGAGLQSAAPVSFNIQNYQHGAFRALTLPNGTTMNLPSPWAPRKQGASGLRMF
ncbi:MAG: hypothetical protein ACREN3_02325 [Gemmatimonadaceae bacterium]